ncbi:MAG: hypothetical protein JNK48_29200 [Bryobacterales bacterium]|nr:hypothetical protein [Bryobacterales bacterium]
MRLHFLPMVCVLATTVLAGGLAAQDEGIDWLTSYEEARTLAKTTGKPIFLEFRCEA